MLKLKSSRRVLIRCTVWRTWFCHQNTLWYQKLFLMIKRMLSKPLRSQSLQSQIWSVRTWIRISQVCSQVPLQLTQLMVKSCQFGSVIMSFHHTERVPWWPFLLTIRVITNLLRSTICQCAKFWPAVTSLKKLTLAMVSTSTQASWMAWVSKKLSKRQSLGWKSKVLVTSKLTTACVTGSSHVNVTGVSQFLLSTGKTVKRRLYQKTNCHCVCQKLITSCLQVLVSHHWLTLTTG